MVILTFVFCETINYMFFRRLNVFINERNLSVFCAPSTIQEKRLIYDLLVQIDVFFKSNLYFFRFFSSNFSLGIVSKICWLVRNRHTNTKSKAVPKYTPIQLASFNNYWIFIFFGNNRLNHLLVCSQHVLRATTKKVNLKSNSRSALDQNNFVSIN